MPENERPYGGTVLVALGWYVTLIAALFVGSGYFSEAARQCEGLGCIGYGLLPYFAFGALIVILLPTLLIARPMSGWIRSAPVAGTATAFLNLLLLVLIAVAWHNQ